MKNYIATFIFISACLWLSPAKADVCHGSGEFHYGTSGTARATVKSGQLCAFPMHIKTRNVSLKIVSAAKNGVAGTANRSTLTYKSKQGFKGQDTFVFAVEDARAGIATMTMTIIVR